MILYYCLMTKVDWFWAVVRYFSERVVTVAPAQGQPVPVVGRPDPWPRAAAAANAGRPQCVELPPRRRPRRQATDPPPCPPDPTTGGPDPASPASPVAVAWWPKVAPSSYRSGRARQERRRMKLPRCRRPCRPLGHPAADSGGGAAVLRRWESAVGAAPCFRPCRLHGRSTLLTAWGFFISWQINYAVFIAG
jgi:hypothetical protein